MGLLGTHRCSADSLLIRATASLRHWALVAPVSPTLGPTVVLQALLGVAPRCVLCGMSSAHLSDTAASPMWSSGTVLNGAGPQARVGGGEAAEWLFAFLCRAEPETGNRSELLVPVPVVGPSRLPAAEGGRGLLWRGSNSALERLVGACAAGSPCPRGRALARILPRECAGGLRSPGAQCLWLQVMPLRPLEGAVTEGHMACHQLPYPGC